MKIRDDEGRCKESLIRVLVVGGAMIFVVAFFVVLFTAASNGDKWEVEQKQLEWDKIVAGQLSGDALQADFVRIKDHNTWHNVASVMVWMILVAIAVLWCVSPTFRAIIFLLFTAHLVLSATSSIKKHYDL